MAKFKTSKTWAKKNLRAVNKLIAYYKNPERRHLSCPFCDLLSEGNCDECPWQVFKGVDCTETDYSIYLGAGSTPIPSRLHRLYGWRIRLKNIIKKGGG